MHSARSINQTLLKCTTPNGARAAVYIFSLGFLITTLHSVYLMVHDSNEVTSYVRQPKTTFTCCSAAYGRVGYHAQDKHTHSYPCKHFDVHMVS